MRSTIVGKTPRALLAILTLAIFVSMATACGGGGSSPTAPPSPTQATGFDKSCEGKPLDSWCVAITWIAPASGENRRINTTSGNDSGQYVRVSFEYTCPWNCEVWVDGLLQNGNAVELSQFHGGLYPSAPCKDGEGKCSTDGLGAMGKGNLDLRCDKALTTTALSLRLHDGPGDLSNTTDAERDAFTQDTQRVDHVVNWIEW